MGADRHLNELGTNFWGPSLCPDPRHHQTLCTVRPILMDVQSPIPCSLHGQAYSLATLRKRSFYYIGYQNEKSRTPPFKLTKMFQNQTFSVCFTMGSGYGLVSRNCASLDATISLATEGPLHGQAHSLGRTAVSYTHLTLPTKA